MSPTAVPQVYEYAVCDLDDDGDLVQIRLDGTLIATCEADAQVKVGVILGQAGVDPDTVKVLIRPF
jgi:2-phospho-L-lactate guanylyltransferase (CobY/MobA/RfbA family)